MTDEPVDPPRPARPVRSPLPGRRPPRSRAVSGSFARSMVEAAVRGTGLIALAVAIGIVLLQLSDDNAQPVAAGGEAVEVHESRSGMSTTTAAPTTTTTVTTVTDTAADAPVKGVTVLVLNGSGRNKQAAPLSERLAAVGYQTLEPGNADRREASVVLCRPEHAGDADPLAAATGLSPSTGTLQDGDFPDAGDAECVVIIGSG